jgi:4-amino-4-deoxy-L-arabinose transferase-like glycosyltransferase
MLAKRLWLVLFIFIAAFYLWGLGSLPFVGPDEPRYAEVAREMLARRDWITPTLGGLPWFEKPALLYWMTIANYRLFGVSEYAARLGPAICGLLTGGFVYWIGINVEKARRSEGQPEQRDSLACFAALAWLSSLGAIAISRAASFDGVVTMSLTGAFACFFVGQLRTTQSDDAGKRSMGGQGWFLVGFYFFIGLSLLAKGLIGLIIPPGVIALYFLMRREWPAPRLLKSLVWGIPLTVAVAAVWYGPMIARHGRRFIDQFIVQHHFARFVTNKYHHPQPFYYYLPVLIVLSLPWTIVMAAGFASLRRVNWRGGDPLGRLRVFSLAWVVVPVIFFSFSGSKLMFYILPAIPAAALLIGERVTCFLRAERGNLVLRLTGLMVLLLGTSASWYLLRRSSVDSLRACVAVSPLFIFALIALVRPQLRRILFVLIAIAMFTCTAFSVKWVAPAVARPESIRDLLTTAAARGFGAVPVVQLHVVERTAEFYAAGRLSYGPDGEPIKFEGASQVADAARFSGGRVLCIVPVEFESQLTKYDEVHSEVIGTNGRVSLIAVSLRASRMVY